ncbi:uncharacterized protein [Ambystoma mexicanum]|uniref:uncharacterized protein n=1 Tax=Ambystoma mexicanum TaxID=8296 RepID=UPI0037E7C900
MAGLSGKERQLMAWAKEAEQEFGLEWVRKRLRRRGDARAGEGSQASGLMEGDEAELWEEDEGQQTRKRRCSAESNGTSSGTGGRSRAKADTVVNILGIETGGRARDDGSTRRGMEGVGGALGNTGDSTRGSVQPERVDITAKEHTQKWGAPGDGRCKSAAEGPMRVIMVLARNALSEEMDKQYHQYLNEFGEITGVKCIRTINSGHVNEFLCWAFKQGKSQAWAVSHLEAVAYFVKLAGGEDPTREALTRYAIKGWARIEGTQPDTRRQLNFAKLVRIVDLLDDICSSAYEKALFRAAYTLAYFGAFRVSEIVASNTATEDGLAKDDVAIEKTSMTMFLRRSKSEPLWRGRIVNLDCIDDHWHCPVCITKAFLQLRPQRGTQLLIHSDGTSLSRFQFQAVLKMAIKKAGWEPQEFGTHSFGIGAATSTWMGGREPKTVARIGGLEIC